MQREAWRIETARINLDREGRGEALYRASRRPPDRLSLHRAVGRLSGRTSESTAAFGINWNVGGPSGEGVWTDERRALLVEEVPKQYDGRYPADVLCFCRGNRSERIFDHVVDALASGTQPDAALLASVGYLLRSTAFAGNGLFGMKPFDGIRSQRIRSAPPITRRFSPPTCCGSSCSTWPKHIAAARFGGAAVRLDPAIKRYLGVGNSAGLGLDARSSRIIRISSTNGAW